MDGLEFSFVAFLVEAYFCDIQSVAGVAVLSQATPEVKESQLLFLKDVARRRGDEISYEFDNYVCSGATPLEKAKLCAIVIMLQKKLTYEQFREMKPQVQIPLDDHCVKKNIVYVHLEENTLEKVPMFYCTKHILYFADGKVPATSINFYILTGKEKSDLLVFLDVTVNRRIQRLQNSVRLWHHIVASADDSNSQKTGTAAFESNSNQSANVMTSKNSTTSISNDNIRKADVKASESDNQLISELTSRAHDTTDEQKIDLGTSENEISTDDIRMIHRMVSDTTTGTSYDHQIYVNLPENNLTGIRQRKLNELASGTKTGDNQRIG